MKKGSAASVARRWTMVLDACPWTPGSARGAVLPAAIAVLVLAGGCGADDDRVHATTSAAGSGGVGLQQPGGGGWGGEGGTVAPPSCGPRWPDSPTVLCAGEQALLDSCPLEGEWGSGQDGSYVGNVPSYETTEEVVVDSVTTIMWQRESFFDDSLEPLSQWRAREYCEELSLAGFDDWRLPAILELATIADYGRSYPAMDAAAFPDPVPRIHWSTTEGYWSYYLKFGPGVVTASDPVGGWMAVRCVRGCTVSTDFSVSTDGLTVHDYGTGLQWQREAGAWESRRSFAQAIEDCEQLELAGYADWRLPNIKELLTTVDFTAMTGPKIDLDAFIQHDGAWHLWSSSPYVYNYNEAQKAWYVDLGAGNSYMTSSYYENGVRCVRSAPVDDGP